MNEFLLFAREIFHILRFNSYLSSDLLVLQLQQGGAYESYDPISDRVMTD